MNSQFFVLELFDAYINAITVSKLYLWRNLLMKTRYEVSVESCSFILN